MNIFPHVPMSNLDKVRNWIALSSSLMTAVLVLASTQLLVAAPTLVGLPGTEKVSVEVEGSLLIRELSCARCHLELAESFPARVAPSISTLVSVRSLDAIVEYLSHPADAWPGTVMPDVLAHRSPATKARDVDALVHFLRSEQSPGEEKHEPRLGDVASKEAQQGEELFRTIGCVICHPQQPDHEGYVRLERVRDRFTLPALISYLKDPLLKRPHSRMPDMHLDDREATAIAGFLLKDSGRKEIVPALDPVLVARGRSLFSELRCAVCHPTSAMAVVPESDSIALKQLDRGCLSSGVGSWPQFSLSPHQRTVIKAVIDNEWGTTESQKVEIALRQFNCTGCHERDGYGGPSSVSDQYFVETDLNLGEQGRVPPSLAGVGAKLKPSWLRQIVVEGTESRPYLKTRMPRFKGSRIDELLALLGESDELDVLPPLIMPEPNQVKRLGRDLVGSDGLSCITCHTYQGKQTGTMGAMDLNLLGQRVTRDWFFHYMRNPSAVSPQTVMPSFWAGGSSAQVEILDGNPDQQIEALWQYLSEGYGMGAPRGVRRDPMRLVATPTEAVMLRRSYREIGKRGIGVGYPGNVNLVYNAEQLCLAMVWAGEFVDPAGVWMSQGHGTARPLAREQIRFAQAPDVMSLEDIRGEWPAEEGRSKRHAFEGYTLDSVRRPTFEYTFEGVAVRDAFVDQRVDGRGHLIRTVELSSEDEPEGMVLRIASESDVSGLDNRTFQLGGSVPMRLLTSVDGVIIERGGASELRIPLEWNSGRAKVVVHYVFENDQ